MQGTNKLKWAELQDQVNRQKIDIYALTETHLRDDEQPLLPGLVWQGKNRSKGQKRGGGIGFITPKRITVNGDCQDKEHMWIKIKIDTRDLYICVIYMATGLEEQKWNDSIYACLKKDIEETYKGQPVLLMGDFNCHIVELDGHEKDAAGFRKLIKQCNLQIANLHPACEGTYTWSRRANKSAIDYILYNQEVVRQDINITALYIDEDKTNSCGSDHNRMKLCLRRHQPHRVNRPETTKAHWRVKEQERLDEFSNKLESTLTEPLTYEEFAEKCLSVAQETIGKTSEKKRTRNTPWFDGELKTEIRIRKELSRRHRHTPNESTEKEVIWKEYLAQKRKVKEMAAKKIDQKFQKEEENLHKDRNHYSQKFWAYIRTLEPKDTLQEDPLILLTENSIPLHTKEEIEQHITKHFKNMQTNPVDPSPQISSRKKDKTSTPEEEKLTGPISKLELKRRINDLKNQKATGLDDIPNEFLKAFKTEAKEMLRGCLNDILASRKIPRTWKESRVKLIHKGKGKETSDIGAYRPITILSNILKLFNTILNRRLQNHCEKTLILSESQNGFRPNRRTSDHIFTLTQAIEMKNRDKSQLYLAYLDLQQAYDSVPHSRLWEKLEKINIEEDFIKLLKALYAECTAVYELGKYKSRQVQQNIGLKQGCPLSPTLFNIYINSLLEQVNREGPGLRLSTVTTERQEIYTKISCLAFADDIVLLAESPADLQHLLDICSRVAHEDCLTFNTDKTQWMGINIDDKDITFTIQGNTIKKTATYRYLGITISDQKNYLDKHQELLLKQSNRLKGRVWHLSRHSYNPYRVGRTLWKTLAVPAITYAGDTLAYSTQTVRCLDRHQNELGRWLLGGSFATANAAVTGELAWSTFEAREARSKIQYAGRLKFLPETNYSQRIYLHLRYRGIKTQWMKRLASLENKFGHNTKLEEAKSEREWRIITKNTITEASTEMWRTSAAKKRSLQLYLEYKQAPDREPFYRGDRESALLFQARTGSLPTRKRHWELFDTDPSCRLCGATEETIQHILMDCPRLGARDLPKINLAEYLGLPDDPVDTRVEHTESAKRRLKLWDRLCWQVDKHPDSVQRNEGPTENI